MIGTCKMNINDSANNDNVREAVRIIANKNVRNDWIIVRAYDDTEKLPAFTGIGSQLKSKL